MELKVEVRDIFYKSDTFMVGIFKLKSTEDDSLKKYINKNITFSGNFHELNKDFEYKFIGDMVDHPKYGNQFKVENYEKLMPEDKNAIISFLSSGLFPKVGIRTASKIVGILGENTLDKILESYTNLLLVPTITEKKAKEIHDILSKEQLSYKTIIYLQDIGFSFNQANSIYKYYKNETDYIIEQDIYKVVENVEGISFTIVDKIAYNMKYSLDDERRINSCILYSINEICFNNGDSYAILQDLYLKVISNLNLTMDKEVLEDYLFKLNKMGKVIIIDDKYYLKNYYEAELNISNKILSLVKKDKNIIKNMDKHIELLEELLSIKYNKLQKESIVSSLENNFTIITGGPGTGKTTIIRAIVDCYRNVYNLTHEGLNDSLALIAPTGRAAKRLKEATYYKASTIHKFLKWNKELDEFSINMQNKSDIKFLIIDEASMIDMFLFKNLLDGIKDDVKIVLVGDYNQLPSVLPGQVLKDLIDTDLLPVIKLNELYRQKEDSYIVTLANYIKDGNIEEDFFEKKLDYNFIQTSRNSIEKIITELCKKAIEKGYSYKELQVLVPMYKGTNGIDNLNKKLQNIFNPKRDDIKEIEYAGITYREGDKVLQIKNLSDVDVSNGDIGIIDYIGDEKDNNAIVIDFDSELVEYKRSDLENIKLGYAISIHKSQGSEFDIVIIPMDMSFNRMLYRKLIYTAVTRAKKSLTLVGEKEALINSINNELSESRNTTLKDNIINNFSIKN